MEKVNLAEGLMAQMMEEEAWVSLSGDFGFTLQMLEKYQDRLDWNEISENTNIVWTVEILDKFKRRINWESFSGRCDKSVLTLEIVERFKDYFDWRALSRNADLPMWIVEKYPEKIEWKELINSYRYDEKLNKAFLEKYSEYIPASAFKDSSLWKNIVDEIRANIENKIRCGSM